MTTTPVHVGIDVAKARLDVCVLPTGQTLSVDNDDDGIAPLIAVLDRHPVALVLLEATGRYERRVASELLRRGLQRSGRQPAPGA
jgi:transposase